MRRINGKSGRSLLRAVPSLIGLGGLFAAFAVAAVSLYRWEDDNGTVHYTDTIPPSQVTKGHTEFSDSGVPLKTVPPAMSMEEVRKQQELARLRAEQERLLEQLRVADRALLRTFRSEDDLLMARDGKLASIDLVIQVTSSNIRRQQERLAALRKQAGNLERSGRPIPRQLQENIANIERAIQDADALNAAREAQKDVIRANFDQDLERFRKLTKVTGDRAPRSTRNVGSTLYDIVRCNSTAQCDELWERATSYLREDAPLPFENGNRNILVTAPPAQETDIGMILARISDPKGEGAFLFLDLLCQTSLSGETLCKASDVQAIIEAFHTALRLEQNQAEH